LRGSLRDKLLCGLFALALLAVGGARGTHAATPPPALPVVTQVEAQPLLAQVKRVVEALDYLGSPLPAETRAALELAALEEEPGRAVRAVQEALDPHCLFGVGTGPTAPVTVVLGPAAPELVEGGWRQFLVKVYNQQGRAARLNASSVNARALANAAPTELEARWLDLQMFNQAPLSSALSGLELEYRILQLYSRDAGERRAVIAFDLPKSELEVQFRCLPSAPVTLRVLDENGQPTTAGFVIQDAAERIYPSLAKRLAPDFVFHPQVYRGDGEVMKLPAGDYLIQTTRGPEYLVQTQAVRLTGAPQTLTFSLQRWVDPSRLGWWSGDHHIHAAGCSHYARPTQGVFPVDVIRHCMGEDLKVGCALTWGPGFDFQKQFFTGGVADVSQFPHLIRYDIEVSGFGSHRSGHLCLLRLKEQIYPGGDSTDHWPTLGLNTLKWAKQQGAICGTAHSGWGLQVRSNDLPNYLLPPYNDIGANEYIVDITHEVPGPDGQLVPAIDFMAAADTPYARELNMWYHTLNCGYRPRLSGETDFPCIYGERVGVGRSYVKLDGELAFDQWVEGIRAGRSYVGDGRSHLMEFKVGDVAVGEKGSELRLAQPGVVRVTARVAALLPEQPDLAIRRRKLDQTPYWHLERGRIGDTRSVPAEVVVNGYPVARQEIVADGTLRDMAFDVPIERSSWVTLRILPSSHTNPVFVLVGGKPIRASRRSADWCLKGVDQCWFQKKGFIAPAEKEDAERAYAHAREAYARILSECEVD
jgi:hypothetical protein